jgi:hypothetical protein
MADGRELAGQQGGGDDLAVRDLLFAWSVRQ